MRRSSALRRCAPSPLRYVSAGTLTVPRHIPLGDTKTTVAIPSSSGPLKQEAHMSLSLVPTPGEAVTGTVATNRWPVRPSGAAAAASAPRVVKSSTTGSRPNLVRRRRTKAKSADPIAIREPVSVANRSISTTMAMPGPDAPLPWELTSALMAAPPAKGFDASASSMSAMPVTSTTSRDSPIGNVTYSAVAQRSSNRTLRIKALPWRLRPTFRSKAQTWLKAMAPIKGPLRGR